MGTVVTMSACFLLLGSAFGQPATQAEELPECGGLTALAQQTTRAVGIVNAGFEEDWPPCRPSREWRRSTRG